MLDWAELESACKECRRCSLFETRHSVVFGVGKRDADVMLNRRGTRGAGGYEGRAIRRQSWNTS